jgi:hypothetical protein
MDRLESDAVAETFRMLTERLGVVEGASARLETQLQACMGQLAAQLAEVLRGQRLAAQRASEFDLWDGAVAHFLDPVVGDHAVRRAVVQTHPVMDIHGEQMALPTADAANVWLDLDPDGTDWAALDLRSFVGSRRGVSRLCVDVFADAAPCSLPSRLCFSVLLGFHNGPYAHWDEFAALALDAAAAMGLEPVRVLVVELAREDLMIEETDFPLSGQRRVLSAENTYRDRM